METDAFSATSGELARYSGASQDLVRQYADEGLIPCRRLANGVRLFRLSDAARVAEIRTRRLANRGRRAEPKAENEAA